MTRPTEADMQAGMPGQVRGLLPPIRCEGYNVAGSWTDCDRPMPHAHGIIADMLEGRRMRIVTAEAVRRAILAAAPEQAVTVEQTGGGTATIYVGAYDGTEHAWLVFGPGRYDWAEPDLSLFWIGSEGSCIGPDDDGETVPLYPETLAEVTSYVATAVGDRDR